MKIIMFKSFISCCAVLSIMLIFLTGCKTSKLIEYSSLADHEQKASGIRTEMLVIKGDDHNIKRNYCVLSAVDYLHDGKKYYYLIIVPALSNDPAIVPDDLPLHYDYPFIIQGRNLQEFVSSLQKCADEWNSTDMKYSGAVYNYFISSPRNPRILVIDNRTFEILPYIKLNYSKTENGAIAKLAIGSRMEEIVISSEDGKTVKSRMFVRDDETFWIFDSPEKMKDFQNLMAKGLFDLRTKGMDGHSGKTEIKADSQSNTKSTEDKKVRLKGKKKIKK